MSKLRRQDGQATIDYVALIAVLAVLLTATTAFAGGRAPGVTNAVLGQFRHALCIVKGGDCPSQAEVPCVVASHRDADHLAVSIALFRVDKDRYVLRERLSDGTVRLTVAEGTGAGIEAGVGGRVQLRLKGRTLGFDREARGGGEAVVGHGDVYLARDDREADEIQRAIGRHGLSIGPFGLLRIHLGGPRPQSIFVEGGVRGLGRLNASALGASVSLDGVVDAMLGASRNQRTGDVTVSLSAEGSGAALLDAALAGPSGASSGQVGLALTFDRHHHPTGLSLNASGTLAAGASLPAGLARALGVGDGQGQSNATMTSRRWELSESVDLSDPHVAAAWEAFRHDPTGLAAIHVLGAHLHGEARIDVRTYAIASTSAGGAGGLGLGLKLGGEIEHAVDRARLLSAASRPPGGVWERRFDCESA